MSSFERKNTHFHVLFNRLKGIAIVPLQATIITCLFPIHFNACIL